MSPPETLRILLDLGDTFAKASAAVAHGPSGASGRAPARVRFPSVVATRLLDPSEKGHTLLLDSSEPLFRPVGFDPTAHPRTGSYAGAQEFLEMASSKPAPPRSRFTGRLAAIYGADRRWLGVEPSVENVAALVHKALMLLCPPRCGEAEVVFVVDSGVKAAAVSRYISTLPRFVEFEVRTYQQPKARRLCVQLEGSAIDAPECAVAALPAEVAPGLHRRLLLVDIGHFRTKLAVFSAEGCELQEQLPIGMADCVRRVLRDGQEFGLVVDEFALIRALEAAREGTITMGKRRFDISVPLHHAWRAVEEELEKSIRRLLFDHYGRRGESCGASVLFGGGAVALGSSLAARLEASQIGIGATWIAPDPSFLLIHGAAQTRGILH
jgi:hypothetical protein